MTQPGVAVHEIFSEPSTEHAAEYFCMRLSAYTGDVVSELLVAVCIFLSE